MRFAVISDIQANYTALQAVLSAIAAREQVDRIVCAGDLVGRGPNPNEVLDLLRERRIEAVLGNYDDAVAFDRFSSGVDFADAASERADREAVEWTRAVLTEENLTYLRQLPRDLRLYPIGARVGVKRNELSTKSVEQGRNMLLQTLFGSLYRSPNPRIRQVIITHGSPRSLSERIVHDSAHSILATIAREIPANVLISAHSGSAFQREAEGVIFIGVTGMSGHDAVLGQAEYAVIELGSEMEVEYVRVPYNTSEHLAALLASRLPAALTTVNEWTD